MILRRAPSTSSGQRQGRLLWPSISYRAFRVWERNRDVFLRLWRTEAAPFVGEPLIILLAMGFGMGSHPRGQILGHHLTQNLATLAK